MPASSGCPVTLRSAPCSGRPDREQVEHLWPENPTGTRVCGFVSAAVGADSRRRRGAELCLSQCISIPSCRYFPFTWWRKLGVSGGAVSATRFPLALFSLTWSILRHSFASPFTFMQNRFLPVSSPDPGSAVTQWLSVPEARPAGLAGGAARLVGLTGLHRRPGSDKLESWGGH